VKVRFHRASACEATLIAIYYCYSNSLRPSVRTTVWNTCQNRYIIEILSSSHSPPKLNATSRPKCGSAEQTWPFMNHATGATVLYKKRRTPTLYAASSIVGKDRRLAVQTKSIGYGTQTFYASTQHTSQSPMHSSMKPNLICYPQWDGLELTWSSSSQLIDRENATKMSFPNFAFLANKICPSPHLTPSFWLPTTTTLFLRTRMTGTASTRIDTHRPAKERQG